MEVMDTSDDPKRLLDKTVQLLKAAGTQAKEGLRRTYEVATIKHELGALRDDRDDALRELGKRTLETVRGGRAVAADDVASAVRRIDDLEERIAAKQRQIEALERDPSHDA
jgi:hypothetical protein